jgi:hypothetical protein
MTSPFPGNPMRSGKRAYEGETCRIYAANYWLTLMPFVLSGMLTIAVGLTLLIALGAELARTGALSNQWLTVLPVVGLFGVVIGVNAWAMRRRPRLLVSSNGIGYITATCSLWTEWANVEQLSLQTMSVLILRTPGTMTGHFTHNSSFTDRTIPLWIFDYAPRSALDKELRAYAPHLFKQTSDAP